MARDWRKNCDPYFAIHSKMRSFSSSAWFAIAWQIVLAITKAASPILPEWWVFARAAVVIFVLKWLFEVAVGRYVMMKIRAEVAAWEAEKAAEEFQRKEWLKFIGEEETE